MLTVTLLTKADCGLCDEVKAILEELQAIYPHHLSEVDITQGAALFKQYRYTIPVVQMATMELTAPITAVQLQQALKNAAQEQSKE